VQLSSLNYLDVYDDDIQNNNKMQH
jgi:hypothetical protein